MVGRGLGSGLLVLPVIVSGQSAHESWTLRLLCHPRVVWVGMISYGLYLWHVPVLDLVGRRMSSNAGAAPLTTVGLTWLLVLVGGTLLGAASWYLVERPFQGVFGPRRSAPRSVGPTGHSAEIDAAVQA